MLAQQRIIAVGLAMLRPRPSENASKRKRVNRNILVGKFKSCSFDVNE